MDPAFTVIDFGPNLKSLTSTLSVAEAAEAVADGLSVDFAGLVDFFASLPPHAPRSASAATAVITMNRRFRSGFRIDVVTVVSDAADGRKAEFLYAHPARLAGP